MTGRELPPTSAFADDDGRADPALSAALVRLVEGERDRAGVVRTLAGARVLVPVVARAEELAGVVDGAHPHGVDSQGSAGIVAIQTPDGRTALPVFSSVETMSAWRGDARPVPASAPRAALSAVDEGWEVMVLDPAGPVPVLIPRPAVWALAQGQEWVPAVVGDVVDPSVVRAVAAALAAVDEVVEVQVAAGGRAEVAVVLTLRAGLRQVELDVVLERVGAALAAEEILSQRVDSFELRLRTA